MSAELLFQITKLDGEVMVTLNQHEGGSVTVPQNDARTAKVQLSIYDRRVLQALPLERALKVSYKVDGETFLPFWGPILQPVFNFGQGNVSISAHDPSLAWKKNYLRYGDLPVNIAYPYDGRGFRRLAEAAIPSPAQLERGVQHPGIKWGYNAVPDTGPMPVNAHGKMDLDHPLLHLDDGSGIWSKVTRGTQIWEVVNSMTEQADGFDWELRPIDADHPPTRGHYESGRVAGGDWEPGYFVQLDTYVEQGVDRRDDVAFHFGAGRSNASDVVWTPDGDSVRNYAAEVFPGGEKDKFDLNHRALSHNEASWRRFGIYEVWESSNQPDTKAILQSKANAWIQRYSYPPDFFTVVIKPDVVQPFHYLRDYEIGDLVSVAAKRGYGLLDSSGGLRSVTLTADAQGAVTTQLDVVPNVGTEQDQTDPGV
jgi:hypothetical protein